MPRIAGVLEPTEAIQSRTRRRSAPTVRTARPMSIVASYESCLWRRCLTESPRVLGGKMLGDAVDGPVGVVEGGEAYASKERAIVGGQRLRRRHALAAPFRRRRHAWRRRLYAIEDAGDVVAAEDDRMRRLVMQSAHEIGRIDPTAGKDDGGHAAACDACRVRLVLGDIGQVRITLGDCDAVEGQRGRDRSRKAAPE